MKKTLILMICAILLVGIAAGCASNEPKNNANTNEGAAAENNQSGSEPAGNDAEPVIDDGSEKLSISMMIPLWGATGPGNDHPIVQKMNEELNIELNVEWVPGASYSDKISVLAASNSLPDIYRLSSADFQNLRDKNVFADVKPYLAQYPNLTNHLPDQAWEELNPVDQYVGIPYYSIPHLFSLAIREDWLENVNMAMPQTIDEFYEVAKAFVNGDPDRNGKADTTGFSILVTNGKFGNNAFLQGAFGLGNEWALKDGQLIPMQVQTEELKDFIGFLRKAYSEGVLDQDFMLLNAPDAKQKFLSGKVGVAQVNPNEIYSLDLPKIQENFPEAKLAQMLPPEGPTGLRTTHTEPMSPNKVVINNKVDEKKLHRILKLLDYMLTDDGYSMIKDGIEGIHYQENNGKYEELDTSDLPFQFSVSFFRRADSAIQLRKYHDETYKSNVQTWLDNNDKYPWPNPAYGLDIETEAYKTINFATLNNKWMSTIVRAIIGDLPLESIDDAAAEWQKSGGDQLIEEVNALYQARQ